MAPSTWRTSLAVGVASMNEPGSSAAIRSIEQACLEWLTSTQPSIWAGPHVVHPTPQPTDPQNRYQRPHSAEPIETLNIRRSSDDHGTYLYRSCMARHGQKE